MASISQTVCLVDVPGVNEEVTGYGEPRHSGFIGSVGMLTSLNKCHMCQQKVLIRGVSPCELCSNRVFLVAESDIL